MPNDSPDLVIGNEYSRTALETAFAIKFGYQVNGIVVRKLHSWPERRLILLFSRAEGPYSDDVGLEEIRYEGSGLQGDQKLSGVNQVLATQGRDVGFHFFRQPAGYSTWLYLGKGQVVDVTEETKEGRRVLVFRLKLGRETRGTSQD